MKCSKITHDCLLQRVGDLFFRLGKGIAQEYGGKLICVTPVLDKMLVVIGHEKNVNIKRIANIFVITSGAATQHVAALEKLGAVERIMSNDDRREINVRLTAKGKELLKNIETNSLHVLCDVFRDFSQAELELLIGLMSKACKKYDNNCALKCVACVDKE
jgi:DNA-binding MarR family transcriptional regulator